VGDRTAEQAWDDCRRHIRIFEARLADGADLGAPVSTAERESVARHSTADAHQGRRLSEGVKSWSKTGHLDRMFASGRFAWCREVAMTSSTGGNADRFVGLLKSQGDYQTLRRHGLDDSALGVDRFAAVVHDRLGSEPHPWRFVYRARLGFAR
jgi:hypothetical protein